VGKIQQPLAVQVATETARGHSSQQGSVILETSYKLDKEAKGPKGPTESAPNQGVKRERNGFHQGEGEDHNSQKKGEIAHGTARCY